MKANKEYLQAKANYTDLQERGSDAIGEDALKFMDAILTPEEKAANDLRVSLKGIHVL